jgi:hypothetical protein
MKWVGKNLGCVRLRRKNPALQNWDMLLAVLATSIEVTLYYVSVEIIFIVYIYVFITIYVFGYIRLVYLFLFFL